MATRKLYQILASLLNAVENCKETGNAKWQEKNTNTIASLVADYLPSGSGFDAGTVLDFDASKGGERLVFHTSFHHMNDAGFYDGWSNHDVVIRPCLALEFSLTVTGRDRRDIKDYIAETFKYVLSQEMTATDNGYLPTAYATAA